MRKITLLSISLVVTIAMLGLMAVSAEAISRNKYEWCYGTGPNRPCYGIVTVQKSSKVWSYTIGGIHGSIAKAAGVWDFDFENADAEACQLRMRKSHRNFVGTEYCDGTEVEAAEWKRL